MEIIHGIFSNHKEIKFGINNKDNLKISALSYQFIKKCKKKKKRKKISPEVLEEKI